MTSAKIETITLTLTADEAYALCNKLNDKALVAHGGYCEFSNKSSCSNGSAKT